MLGYEYRAPSDGGDLAAGPGHDRGGSWLCSIGMGTGRSLVGNVRGYREIFSGLTGRRPPSHREEPERGLENR